MKVLNIRRNFPDIAHAASANAAVRYFKAYRFKPVRTAGFFQSAIANAVAGQFPDTLGGVHCVAP